MKDTDYKEYGIPPKVVKGTSAFSDAITLGMAGDFYTIKDSYPDLYLRYETTLESLFSFDSIQLSIACGVWLYGPPRTDKDFAVCSLFGGSLYVESLTEWWYGYFKGILIIKSIFYYQILNIFMHID